MVPVHCYLLWGHLVVVGAASEHPRVPVATLVYVAHVGDETREVPEVGLVPTDELVEFQASERVTDVHRRSATELSVSALELGSKLGGKEKMSINFWSSLLQHYYYDICVKVIHCSPYRRGLLET